LQKVNKPVLTQWIEQKITSILGFEDEIVSSMAINLFLPSEGEDPPDPKRGQLDLAGFLGIEESSAFCKELWKLMLEGQENSVGIPKTLLEQKKKELAEKAAAEQQKDLPRSREDRVLKETKLRPADAVAMPPQNNYNNQNHNGGRWDDRPPHQPSSPIPIPDHQGEDGPPQLDQFGRAYRNTSNSNSNISRGKNSQRRMSEQRNEGPATRPYASTSDSRRRGRDRNREDEYYHRRGHHRHPYYDQQCHGGEDIGYGDRRRLEERRRYDDRWPTPPPGRYDDRRSYSHNQDGYHVDRRYDEDRRMREELEQRLALLKKKQSRSSVSSSKVESEIENIEDRLYKLGHRIYGRTSREDYGRRDRDGERSSPPNRGRRRKDDDNPRSDDHQRSRSYSTDSDQSSNSTQSGDPSEDESDHDDDDDDSRSRSRSRSRSYSYSDESRK
jgi:hypothetical protein